MAATQSGSNGFLAADFARHFEQANEQAKSVLAVRKSFSMLLHKSMSTGSSAPNQKLNLPPQWQINSRRRGPCQT